MLLLHAFLKTPSFLHFVTIFLDGTYNILGAFSVARLCLWSVGNKMGKAYAYAHLWSKMVWLEHIQSTRGRMRQVYGKPNAAKINFYLLLIFLSTLASLCLYNNDGPTGREFSCYYTAAQWVSCLSQLSHCWSVLGYEAVSLLCGARPMSSSCHPIFITYLESVWRLFA